LKADLTLVELKANRTELASKADATAIAEVRAAATRTQKLP